jgi:hypothetical protein
MVLNQLQNSQVFVGCFMKPEQVFEMFEIPRTGNSLTMNIFFSYTRSWRFLDTIFFSNTQYSLPLKSLTNKNRRLLKKIKKTTLVLFSG